LNPLASSFRDPSGFIFSKNGKIYRQINPIFFNTFTFFLESGLYQDLVDSGFLVPHEVVEKNKSNIIIFPYQLSFISYPYEWCFSQLKDAALLTLDIQLKALEYGMTLKDASAFNIQFENSNPIFIDTLSFEKYHEGEPWIAYRQFCQHFLAPLLLAKYTHMSSLKYSQLFIDGIPLDVAVSQLPLKAFLRPSVFIHIYLHSQAQKINSKKSFTTNKKFSLNSLKGLINSLKSLVSSLNFGKEETEWGDYYTFTNYDKSSAQNKESIILKFIESAKPANLVDLGGNNGRYTRLALKSIKNCLLFDIDYNAIESSYKTSKKYSEIGLNSYILDLVSPSPSIGWLNHERDSIFERIGADMVLALALIHHICISNNVPMSNVVKLFEKITRKWLIIEFVPKNDSQVQKLLNSRKDIFESYNHDSFLEEFSRKFEIVDSVKVHEMDREIFLMKKHEN